MPSTATMASPHRVTLEDRSLDSTSLRDKEKMRVTFPVGSAAEPGRRSKDIVPDGVQVQLDTVREGLDRLAQDHGKHEEVDLGQEQE